MKKLFALAIYVCVIQACKHIPIPHPVPETPKCKLVEQIISGDTVSYIYNTHGQIVEINSKYEMDSGQIGRYIEKYEYDAEGRLLEQRLYAGWLQMTYQGRVTYQRSGQVITLTDYSFFNVEQKTGRRVYTLDNNDKLIKHEEYFITAAGSESIIRTVQYETDSHDNPLVARYYNHDGKLEVTSTRTYDDKHSLESLHPVATIIPTAKNNPVRRVEKKANGTISDVTISYSYNTNGYVTGIDKSDARYIYSCH
jgi:hypothetical protein